MTTYRAKRHDSLREKLEKRAVAKPYASMADIYDDIVDLAGVRLALYFPGDRAEVERILRDSFDVLKKKQFPHTARTLTATGTKTFSGYGADHYRLKLRPVSLSDAQKYYADTPIEVQVASVLMHGWAEVEHDLLYKPRSGSASAAEEAILDSINGLVLSGEIALKLLQQTIKDRAKAPGEEFHNHYELAAYLLDTLAGRLRIGEEPLMGRADVLLSFLQKVHLDRPADLAAYLEDVTADGTDGEPIADRVIDEILFRNPDFHRIYTEARREASPMSPYREGPPKSAAEEEAIGRFMGAWVDLERLLNSAPRSSKTLNLARLPRLPAIDASSDSQYKRLRHLRNQVVHGMGVPPVPDLDAASEGVRELTGRLAPVIAASANAT